jgi:L-asparaginase II
VHGVALIPSGIGLVSKVLDGTARARAPVTMAALRALGSPVADATDLRGFAAPIVYNRAGHAVGEIRAVPDFAVEQAST